MLTIRCEDCGKLHQVYPNEIRRGRGQFCCNKCKATHNHDLKSKRVCPTCNQPFITYKSDRIYCCIECEENEIDTITTDDESTNE